MSLAYAEYLVMRFTHNNNEIALDGLNKNPIKII